MTDLVELIARLDQPFHLINSITDLTAHFTIGEVLRRQFFSDEGRLKDSFRTTAGGMLPDIDLTIPNAHRSITHQWYMAPVLGAILSLASGPRKRSIGDRIKNVFHSAYFKLGCIGTLIHQAIDGSDSTEEKMAYALAGAAAMAYQSYRTQQNPYTLTYR